MLKNKILLNITGSIAAYKSAYLISRLVQNGYEVQAAATNSALKFIGRATLEGLTGRPVFTDSFESGKMMSHIELAKWADLTITAPATANTINKFASGIGDHLITSLFLAHEFSKPYLIAPAMNVNMYNHPVTRESISKLEKMGVIILPTEAGYLACGDYGEGKLLDPDKIFAAIVNTLTTVRNTGKRILITGGGTTETIDGIRSVNNLSTGRTGAAIADELYTRGNKVELIRAANAQNPKMPIKENSYRTYNELKNLVRQKLSEEFYDCVIHLAAVSDYLPIAIEVGRETFKLPLKEKLSSEYDKISVVFGKTEKLVDSFKSVSQNKNLKVVSFKLLTNNSGSEAQVQKLFEHSWSDLVVMNSLQNRVGEEQRVFRIYSHSGSEVVETAERLAKYLHEKLNLGDL